MKKMCLFIITILVLILCGCSSETDGWKTIYIPKCGTIKIPPEWDYYVENETMYIMKNESPIMISYNITEETYSNSYFSDFRYIDTITSAVLSNSAIYGKAKYSYLDDEIERYFLNLGSIKEEYEFLVWNEEIDKELLVKIAKTFVMEHS